VDGRRGSRLPVHQFRSHAGRSLENIPLHQANWIGALNALLREHNHRHSRKEKDVSFKTMHERREFYFRFFRELRDSGYNLDPRSLGNRHVQFAVDRWIERGLSAATIQTYLSFLRSLSYWIGKHGMIQEPGAYVSDPARVRRTYVALQDKSWSAAGVDAGVIVRAVFAHDPRCGAMLDLIVAFGLRVKEALMLRPHLAVVPATATSLSPRAEWYVEVVRGTKGGRCRFVPIDSDAKLKALDRAQRLVGEGAHLGNPRLDLKAGKAHFYRVMARFGITNRDLGVTPHGLRHQYANDRYESFSGVSSTVRHGPPLDPALDTGARLEVAAELGHARKEIAGAYLGQSYVMRSKRGKVSATTASAEESEGANAT